MCLYLKKNNEIVKKFSDKDTIRKLYKSYDGRMNKEMKQNRADMKDVLHRLEGEGLSDNYVTKFGHLKKASVLYFYGRYNEAFDQIAKAA